MQILRALFCKKALSILLYHKKLVSLHTEIKINK